MLFLVSRGKALILESSYQKSQEDIEEETRIGRELMIINTKRTNLLPATMIAADRRRRLMIDDEQQGFFLT